MRLILTLALLCAPQQSGTISITTADDVRSAKSLAIKEISGKLCVEYETLTGGKESLPCLDVVEIAIGTPTDPTPSPALVELITTAGDSIFGTHGEAGRDSVHLQNPGLGAIEIPFSNIEQIRFKGNRAQWPDASKIVPFSKRTSDSIWQTNGDERKGTLLTFTAKSGVEIYIERTKKNHTVSLANAAVALFMPLPNVKVPAPPAVLHSVLILNDGSSIQGKIAKLEGGQLVFEDLFGVERKVAAAAVAGIYFKNGRVVYLSDVAPKTVDENANYVHGKDPIPSDLVFPFKTDRNVLGEPLKVRGQTFRKGLGVHARSSLTWEIAGQTFKKFQATIGIDDAAGRIAPDIGNVTFRVVGDGKALFDSGAVTPKDKPKPVVIDIDGVKSLTLEVTFGTDDLSQGDLADWALARVIR